jgi:uncharacterized protein YodC (DUF2158 family)
MFHPVQGPRVTYTDYFASGTLKCQTFGALGGVINGIGVTSRGVVSKAASPAIAYGLGHCGIVIAAIWG